MKLKDDENEMCEDEPRMKKKSISENVCETKEVCDENAD